MEKGTCAIQVSKYSFSQSHDEKDYYCGGNKLKLMMTYIYAYNIVQVCINMEIWSGWTMDTRSTLTVVINIRINVLYHCTRKQYLLPLLILIYQQLPSGLCYMNDTMHKRKHKVETANSPFFFETRRYIIMLSFMYIHTYTTFKIKTYYY